MVGTEFMEKIMPCPENPLGFFGTIVENEETRQEREQREQREEIENERERAIAGIPYTD